LGILGEQKLRGGGSYRHGAVCDGFFYKGQDVAIVGAGITAREASYLAIFVKGYLLSKKG